MESSDTYRILGPLQVGRGFEARYLGGPRQRLVLAILLAHPNRLVTTDALVEGLWGDHPPASPTASLHSYISNLRKILGADRIERAAGGYAICLEADELDALRFERLVGEARGADDPTRRIELLDEALALWDGPAFADLSYSEPLRAECVRLEELRLRAEEERFEAHLALGPQAQVLVDLQAAVARDPLRERFRAQLMQALYQAGRQAEALSTFREYRLALAEELGLEVGEDLWSLEERILNHDPHLTPAGGQALAAIPDPAPHSRRWWQSWSLTSMALGILLTGTLGETCQPVPSGATHWWSAERSGDDALGGTAARLVDDAAYGPGIVGDAFLLDGDGDFIETGVFELGSGTDDFTIALWVRFDTTQGEQVLAEKWVQKYEEPSIGWTFTKLDDDALGFFTESPSGGAQAVVSGALDLPVGRWIHLAARRLSDRLEILMDGAVVAYHPHDSVVDLTSPVSVKLGHRGAAVDTPGSEDVGGFYLDGAIDEVLLATGEAFTPDEVDRLLAGGAGGGLCPPSL